MSCVALKTKRKMKERIGIILSLIFTLSLSLPLDVSVNSFGDFTSVALSESFPGPGKTRENIWNKDSSVVFSMNSDTILVGFKDKRRVSIYTLQHSNWTLVSNLIPSDYDVNDSFGSVVSLRNDVAIVGAPGWSSSTGCVYVFRDLDHNKITWRQVAQLTAIGGMIGDLFGSSIVNLGTALVIGSPHRTYSGQVRAGGAIMFALNDDWSYTQSNDISYLISGIPTQFGYSLTETENILLIGGRFQRSSEVGAMLTINGIIVTALRSFVVNPENASFALSPIAAAIGIPSDKAGGVVIFSLRSALKFLARVVNGIPYSPADGSLGDKFGAAVAFLRNDTLLVGAPYHQQTGAVYVYKPILNLDEWQCVTKINPQSFNVLNYGSSLATYGGDQIIVSFLEQGTEFAHVIKIRNDVPDPIGTPTPTLAPTQAQLRKNQSRNQNFLGEYYGIPTVIGGILVVVLCVIICVRKYYGPKLSRSVKPHQLPSTQNELTGNDALKRNWILKPSSLTIDNGPVLGTGGFGIVRKGIYQDGARMYPVAIKIISVNQSSNEKMQRKLWDEAALMVELRSPFIVEVYGKCGNMLVMELMSLGSLFHMIESNHEFLHRSEVRIQIMLDVIKGIEYLHDKNIIHGDIKSPNILLCEEGGSLKAKISDFGLSKIVDGLQLQNGTVTPNAMSLNWAAPELLQESPQLTRQVDIYAYGVVSWELLTLKKPYDGLSVGAVIRKVVCGEREVIPSATPDLLEHIITSCWSESPENRPNAAQVREDLGAYRDSLDRKETSHITSITLRTENPTHSGDNDTQVRQMNNSINLDETSVKISL